VTIEELKSKLAPYRNEILWWEICCYLHDIGKLSSQFLDYRRRWHKLENGYAQKDPHDHDWLEKDELLANRRAGMPWLGELREWFRKQIPEMEFPLSIEISVHEHIGPSDNEYIKLLKAGDANDSAYDRNNPLFGCEQTNHADPDCGPEMYRSNVFGYEGPENRADGNELDRRRLDFYRYLHSFLRNTLGGERAALPSYREYREFKKQSERCFEPAMSDTTRPGNDTSLWEHVYAVTSITKALHVESRVKGEWANTLFPDVQYSIWGFGFDGMRFLSNAHRIGDLLGRRDALVSFFQKAEKLLTFDIPFGNEIYLDSECVFYVCPNLADEYYAPLEAKLRELSLETTDGELVPSFSRSGPTHSMTWLVKGIEELRGKNEVPVRGQGGALLAGFRKYWTGIEGKAICPVCRFRPVLDNEAARKVCQICRGRRRGWAPDPIQVTPDPIHVKESEETPFLDEIGGASGRIVLILAQFGLRDWLRGAMVRTTFVSEPRGMERTLGALEHFGNEFQEDYQERRPKIDENPRYEWARMRSQLNSLSDRETDFLFLYGLPVAYDRGAGRLRLNRRFSEAKGFWDQWQAMEGNTDLLNLICAKTPTPSTILDVWHTTQEFFERLGKPVGTGEEARLMGIAHRRGFWMELKAALTGVESGDVVEVEFDGNRLKAVYQQRGVDYLILSEEYRIPQRNFKVNGAMEPLPVAAGLRRYYPARVILTSPDLFLALVPASEALRITREIEGEYWRRFGKVAGRLPLSIGHIYFPRHLPMFSVLDAARRMERNFRQLHEKVWLEQTADSCLVSRVNQKLGTGEEDWFHPYFVTGTEDPAADTAITVAGPVIHASRAAGKSVLVRPNWFDFEMLGASADRLRLHVEPPWDRVDDPGARTALSWEQAREGLRRARDETRTAIRWEDRTKMERFWRALKDSGATDAGVRNLEALLRARWKAWEAEKDTSREAALGELAIPLVSRFLAPPAAEMATELLQERLLFRTLDFYLRILKERLDE